MPLTLYDASLPVMMRGLRNLAHVLGRGRAHADAIGLPHAELLDARFFPDMLPLVAQVQRASDGPRFFAMRVAQVDNPPMSDSEASFDELQARINATLAFLGNVPPSRFEGREEAEIVLPVGGGRRVFTGRSYLLDFALPNFFFHVTTAYDLLRHKGVPLGKGDFLGWTA